MRWKSPLLHSGGEGFPGDSCCRTGVDASRDERTRVVVEDIHDPDGLAVRERPAGGVDLPRVVRTGPLEPLPGDLGSLVRLRSNEASSHQHSVDRRDRRNELVATLQLVGDALRPAVDRQFFAQPDDGLFSLG